MQLLLLFIIAVGVLFIFYYFPPETNQYYPKCFFKSLTTFDCPGCGSARAIHAILHGNFLKAMDYNFLLIMLLPVMVIGSIASYTSYFQTSWNALNKPILYFILILIFWIARNIPYFPLTVLHSDK